MNKAWSGWRILHSKAWKRNTCTASAISYSDDLYDPVKLCDGTDNLKADESWTDKPKLVTCPDCIEILRNQGRLED